MKNPELNSDYLQQLFRPEDFAHLIAKGILLEITYDTETTDLSKKYSFITQFAGVITDIRRQIIKSLEVKSSVPEHLVMAPQAALITQTFPHEIHYNEGRDPPHIAAGKIAHFFKNAFSYLWDALEETETTIEIVARNNPIKALNVDSNYEIRREKIRTYEYIDENGNTSVFRLHNGGRALSFELTNDTIQDSTRVYRDEDGRRWKKSFPRSLTNGFNNIRADDSWIMMTAFTSSMADIIIPYLKENNLFRGDTRALAKAAAALNQEGENGFQPGEAVSIRTGETYLSFGLAALMHANTHREAAARGLKDGVLMPDLSFYDERLGHKAALYDVLATTALKDYIRSLDPEVVRQIELNSDLERLKNFLMGTDSFELRPLRTFLRDNYPGMPHVRIGVCVGINENITERPQAVFARTGMDALLAETTYKGKDLIDLSVDELAVMLQEQRGKTEAVFEVIDLRKSPTIFTGAIAFERGFANTPDRHEINRNFVQSNREFIDRVMAAHAQAMPSFPSIDDTENPRIEEEVFTNFKELKQLEIDMGDGKQVLLPDEVHYHAAAVLERARNIDYILRTLLEPDPVEWLDDLPPHRRLRSLQDFSRKIEKAQKDLQRYNANIRLPRPDASYKIENEDKKKPTFETLLSKRASNAVSYVWKLRASLRHAFYDYSLSYRVHDALGQEVDFKDLVNMPPHIRSNHLATGEYTIHFEQLNYSSENIMRLFWTTPGRKEWLKSALQKKGAHDELDEVEEWEEFFNALAALHLHGAPNKDVDELPWMSAAKGLREIERIRRNFKTGVDVRADEDFPGLWDLFVTDREKAESILAAVEKHYKEMLAKYPLTAARQRLMGYDAKGWPVENVKYPIAANDPILMLDIPDTLLKAPLRHIDMGGYLIPVLAPQGIDLTREMENKEISVLLRGKQSGHICLGAKAKIISEITDDPYYGELYELARKHYLDNAMPCSESQILWLKVERIPEEAPVAIREPDANVQQLKTVRWEDFEGTVSLALGRRQQYTTGFVIKDEGFVPRPGPARIISPVNDNGSPGGWERTTSIESVKTLTLKEFREEIARALKREKADSAQPQDGGAIIDSEFAKSCGYPDLASMRSEITKRFTDMDRSIDDPESLIHIGRFSRVLPETTTFFDPTRRPVAAFASLPKARTRRKLWNGANKILALN